MLISAFCFSCFYLVWVSAGCLRNSAIFTYWMGQNLNIPCPMQAHSSYSLLGLLYPCSDHAEPNTSQQSHKELPLTILWLTPAQFIQPLKHLLKYISSPKPISQTYPLSGSTLLQSRKNSHRQKVGEYIQFTSFLENHNISQPTLQGLNTVSSYILSSFIVLIFQWKDTFSTTQSVIPRNRRNITCLFFKKWETGK